MKKHLIGVLGVAASLLLAGCGNDQASGEDAKEVRVGFGVGTYEQQFKEGILPILEEKGYTVDTTTFSQNMQLNPAMQEGSIDASIFQSTAYMEGMNDELNMNMTGIAFVPSAPQGLYSEQHQSLDEVEDGTTVGVPNDPVNQERAVRILEELGWVTVSSDAGVTDFNLKGVETADYDIDIKVLDPAQILVSLQDIDFGVVNGNYIANAPDRKITDALKIEDTPEQHRIVVTIDEENEDAEWAKDLKAAYESEEFKEYIESNEQYDGFILTEEWN
ncbi:MetQ/NlpA family ABC transporter substrate-binding protein [Planococcus sp. APC 3906]|uniref:MetQ/NlpA family ABC transporter substrate-binding protein n=1 Tax=Planococcus sp. APC 3906 TaxID=3035194 RepID=UPI0025B2E0C2|nr:MetQ/NlpA family ABC transporter substrate-binding protein [Planococcus sp. APC 3906]MDN3449558.1 MetQ/NlpA family ABC transporter substrate-binding protein [Planococcus sp. APC 3906]